MKVKIYNINYEEQNNINHSEEDKKYILYKSKSKVDDIICYENNIFQIFVENDRDTDNNYFNNIIELNNSLYIYKKKEYMFDSNTFTRDTIYVEFFRDLNSKLLKTENYDDIIQQYIIFDLIIYIKSIDKYKDLCYIIIDICAYPDHRIIDVDEFVDYLYIDIVYVKNQDNIVKYDYENFIMDFLKNIIIHPLQHINF